MNGWQAILAYTDANGWHAGIGDPSVMGWLTVLGYFVAAWFCAKAGWGSGAQPGGRRIARFWLCMVAILVVLGINKQLDLQTLFTLLGKRVAQGQGWYEQRRAVQGVFILAVFAGSVAALRWSWRLVGERAGELWLPLAGFALLLCFVVIRAASFHHVDRLLHFSLAGMKLNWIFELGGICMVALGARAQAPVRRLRSRPQARLA